MGPVQRSEALAFGALLKRLRKEAGMTQSDLAAALGYSESMICSLEKAQRLPDLQAVAERFVPALGLQDDRGAADAFVAQAALARGLRAPVPATNRHPASMAGRPEIKPAINPEIADRRVDLPPLPTALVGREHVVNQLSHRLAGHQGRLLTLVGAPGVGKTTLALAVAGRVQAFYPNGAIFVSLAAVADAALMSIAVLLATGGRDTGGTPDRAPDARLIGHLRRKKMLLVLDNLEQIDGAAGLIASLLAECLGLCILATSRERLHLRAEQRFKVPPLDPAAALELFVQRAQEVAADFHLTLHNRPTLETICQRLDYLPLALELCAAQIDLLSPAQLLAHLRTQPLDLLVDGAHDLPLRQRTLRSAILHSYALLQADEQRLLRSLGVFAGGFVLAEVSALMAAWSPTGSLGAEHVQRTLHTLIGSNLVRSETTPDGEPRFSLLETIRAFALEQLRMEGEEAKLRRGHHAVYLRLFRTGDRHLRRPDAPAWLARLRPECDNVRAALQWALDGGHYTEAASMMVVISYFWGVSGDAYEETRWLAQLLPHRHALPPDLHMACLLTFQRAASTLQEFPATGPWTEEVTALLAVCDDKLLHAFAWSLLAATMPDFDQAAAARERSIALARAAGDDPTLDLAYGAISDQNFVLSAYLQWFAVFLIEQGELARAAPIAAEGLARARTQGSPWGISDGCGIVGRLALLADLGQAQGCLQEAVTIAATFHIRQALCTWQPFLGLVTLYGGAASEARRLLNESLELCLEQKDTLHLAQVYTFLAEVELHDGAGDAAGQWLAQSMAQSLAGARPARVTVDHVQRCWVAARLVAARQQYHLAATLFGLADRAHSEIHYAVGGPMRVPADAALAAVQDALEPAHFAAAFATGQQLSPADAFAALLAASSNRALTDQSDAELD